MKRKLLLISPTERVRTKGFSLRKSGTRMLTVPPLGLASVAALTSDDFDISLIDERVEDIDFNHKADLVAISTLTASAPRAYYIADRFRKKGLPVVMGGIHPSALPDEAIQHADAVLIGEAEGAWQQLLLDFKKGKLKKFYKNETLPDVKDIPRARRDIFKKHKYTSINTLQITRGCPMNCEFCSVTKFFGATHRQRQVDDVIEEIKEMKKTKQSFSINPITSLVSYAVNKFNIFIFTDDNIFGNPKYAEELFRKLIPLKIHWSGQASITVARNEKLLELAAKSGCTVLFIGFESISDQGLKNMGKTWNKGDKTAVETYEEAIKKIHKYGIGIQGAFILGYGDKGMPVIKKTIDFIEKNHLEMVQFTVPTPLPGTRLYEKLEKEGRLLHKDWSKYDTGHVVFEPEGISAAELQKQLEWATHRVYSFKSIFKRVKQRRIVFYWPNLLYRWAMLELFAKRPGSQSC
ncbi:MAG: radical SAM protein [archaeon]